MEEAREYKTHIRFNNISNVHRFLGRISNDLYNENISVERARALGYLCSIMIKSIEIKDIDTRLNNIEEAFRQEAI